MVFAFRSLTESPLFRGLLIACVVLLFMAVVLHEKRIEDQRTLEEELNSLRPVAHVEASSRFDSMRTPSSRPVWPDRPYCVMDGVELMMDLYYPLRQNASPSPVVIYVHGGGWRAGDKDWIAPEDVEALTRHGYVVAAVNYRLDPGYRFPAAVQDIACAVRSVKAQSATYGLDKDAVILWGHSAGAQLAALVALGEDEHAFAARGPYQTQSSAVRALGLYAVPADLQELDDFENRSVGMLIPQVFGSELARASPITYVSALDPPVFLAHGEFDFTVSPDQSYVLDSVLRQAGVRHEFVLSQYSDHSLYYGAPDREAIAEGMASFFDRVLGRAQEAVP